MQQSGCLPPLLRLYYTDGFLTWRLVLGYWPAALHPESAPLVGSRWGQPRWSGQLATQVVLAIKQISLILGFLKRKLVRTYKTLTLTSMVMSQVLKNVLLKVSMRFV